MYLFLLPLADEDRHGYGIMQHVAALTDQRLKPGPRTRIMRLPGMVLHLNGGAFRPNQSLREGRRVCDVAAGPLAILSVELLTLLT